MHRKETSQRMLKLFPSCAGHVPHKPQKSEAGKEVAAQTERHDGAHLLGKSDGARVGAQGGHEALGKFWSRAERGGR